MGESRQINVGLIITADGKVAVAELDKVTHSAGKMESGFGSLAGAVPQLRAVLAMLAVGTIAHELMEAAVAADRMTNAITAATGSAAQGAAELQFVRAEAQRLGLDLLSASDAYTSLAASAKGTRLEGQATRDIFSAVSEATTTLGLSADETKGALLAIQQMMSKGTVQAEELRGQLGERLPGAFQVAARAMGVSTAELGKMLEGGKVISDEFLPRFATELKNTFGVSEAATHSAQAEINRFNTAIFEMKKAIVDQGGADSLKTLASWGASVAGVFRDSVYQISDAKIRFQDLFHRIGALSEGNWFSKAGRAEIAAALAAQDQMFEWQEKKLEERRAGSLSVPPPGPPGGGGGGPAPDAGEKDKETKRLAEISMLKEQMLTRDLLIGKAADEKALIQLDQKHREEINRLKGLKATEAQIEEAEGLHTKERLDLVANQKLEKDKALAAAELSIAARNFQEQAAWQDKLDAYKLKTGKVSEEEALSAKFDRERQLLGLKQDEVALQIEAEKNEAKRNELIAEYWRIQAQIVHSHEEEAQGLDEIAKKTEDLTSTHRQRMAELAASAEEARLLFIGDDLGALEIQHQAKLEAIQSQYQQELELAGENYNLQLQAKQAFEAQMFETEQQYAQQKAALWMNNAQTYVNFAQQMSTMAVQMLLFEEKQKGQIGKRMLALAIRFLTQELQAFMLGKAKEHVLLALSANTKAGTEAAAATTSLTIGGSMAAWWATFYSAMSLNPYGGQAFAPAATAMTAVAAASPAAIAAVTAAGTAGGTVNAAAEWAQAALWAAGAIAVGAIGEGLASSIEGGTSGSNNAAGYGAGTPGSPVVTQGAGATEPKPAPMVNIHIYGNVYDQDKFARDIIPSIRKALSDGERLYD